MIENATLTVCDDIRFENNGKLISVGVYPSDIGVNPGPFPVQKLMFLFQFDGPMSSIPKKIEVEITLPNTTPRRVEVQPPPPSGKVERNRWSTRGVVTVQNEILQLGRIGARVICDDEAREVVSPWVVASEPTPIARS